MQKDMVIVVNERDEVVGSASKFDSHRFVPGQPRGILHRAFSVFLFDGEGRLLLQKRASHKITFPDVWTNTCCSHQLTGFDPTEVDNELGQPGVAPMGVCRAAVRKLEHELGIAPSDVPMEKFKFLTRLHYYAADSITHGKHSVWGEHEIDYILFLQLKERPQMTPHPEEVGDVRWVTPEELKAMMVEPGLLWSPWFVIIAQRWLLPLWWNGGDPKSAEAHVDVETVHRFDPPPVHRAGAGVCGLLKEGASAGDLKKQGAYGKIPSITEPFFRQLMRIDEVTMALYYKLSGKGKGEANLDRSNADVAYLDDMLGKVSRSFAAVIRQLPRCLCLEIVVFYMALRGLDTVEDDMTSFPSPADKIYVLRRFHETVLVGNAKALLSGRPSLAPFLGEEAGGMKGLGEGDEAALLENFDVAGRVFNSLAPVSRAVIADITKRMGEGMAEFVERDLGQGTTSMEDYNLYCHYVAGLVGEGLSRLFEATGTEGPEIGGAIDLSNSMGLFLQKTNIIRDYLEDYVDGRAFWPQEIWRKHSTTGQLGQFVLPQHQAAGLACLNELVTDALELIPKSFQYMSMCQHPLVFRFCAIPQVMAIATLAEVYNNPNVFAGVVKIRKGLAVKMILDSDDMVSVASWFGLLAEGIKRRIPTRDPSAERTLKACEEVARVVKEHGGEKRAGKSIAGYLTMGLGIGAGAAYYISQQASGSTTGTHAQGVAMACAAAALSMVLSSFMTKARRESK